MSKTVKNIIMRDYKSRIAGGTDQYPDAMLISIRGVKAIDTTKMRHGLAAKKIKVTVVQNALARKTFEGTNLAPLAEMLSGSNAIAYGGQSVVEVAREIMGWVAKMPKLELKGAILDGTLYKGKAGCEELSKFPTREEAIAKAVTLIVSPGRNLLAQLKGPGTSVAGLVKAIETRLEKGEAIAAKA
ncbi:50S ribosomal protein L10 [Phycisphaerales bacterium]|nr:50S ribosomal protein L10 [Phycisphaerales bacterium]